MPDLYATITNASQDTVQRIAQVLELRAANGQQQAMLATYLAGIPWPDGAKVLEIGCGTGAIARKLAAWPKVGVVIGLDPSPLLLERARALSDELSNLTFQEGDGRSLPFPAAEFDVVVIHTALSHIPQPQQVLAEAHRVLRTHGTLAIFDGDYATATVACGDFDPLQQCVEAAMTNLVHDRWLVRRLPALVESHDFRVASFRSHGYVEANVMDYMLTLIDRGADFLVADGSIGDQTAACLKQEARRRVSDGHFFGHIAYASLIAHKVPKPL